MNESARVRYVGALEELRIAMQLFADHATVAVDTVDGEIRRTEQWLEQQHQNWRVEIRRSEDAVFIAKQELSRKKMMQIGDHPVDTWEEEQALRRARARLEHAEDKLERVRHWQREWSGELLDYEGPSRTLKSFIEGEISRACAMLQAKVQMLEEYLAISSPDGGSRASVGLAPPATLAPSTAPQPRSHNEEGKSQVAGKEKPA